MKHDAKRVTPLPDYQLQVELAYGRVGVFDVRPFFDHPGMAALRDAAYFGRAGVLYGAVTWPDGEDIAPETLDAEMKFHAAA